MSKPFNATATITELIELYIDAPVDFVEDMLKASPDDWQCDVLNDLASHSRVSVRSGQGVGKTALEAWSVLWFISTRPNPKIVCTAPTKAQLSDVLWAEIGKWLEKSLLKFVLKWTKTKLYMKGREDRWFATMRTATRAENMQGFHEDNMLFIVDEASGLEDTIMEAIFGTLSGGEENRLLMCGNPTKTHGAFFDSHNKDRAEYRTHKVSSLDSPRTSKENIAMLKRKYGEGSDVYRVRVEGEFPRGAADAFITLEAAEAAKLREIYEYDEEDKCYKVPLLSPEPIKIGVDVARFGDDETVIATRKGYFVFPLRIYHNLDTMDVAGCAMKEAKKYFKWCEKHEKNIVIRIDDTGLGGGVTDRLKQVVRENEYPIDIVPINFASAGDSKYDGIVSLMYGHFKKNILEFVQLPDDQDLIAQLSVRRYQINSDGRIKLESKKEMKARGLKSPDRAEAVIMAFAPLYPREKCKGRSNRERKSRR
jgi:phage terminase large subunit